MEKSLPNDVLLGSEVECEEYKPANGTWLIVYLTFTGNASNEVGGYDVAAIKIVDSAGNVYNDIEPNGAVDEWRQQSGVTNLSLALINKAETKQYFEMYDIPSSATGLKAQWWGYDKNHNLIAEAEVVLQ